MGEFTRSKKSPLQKQQEAALLTGYGPIHIYREGIGSDAKIVVAVEAKFRDGQRWVPIFQDSIDSHFSCFVEPLGIEGELRRAGWSEKEWE